MFFARLACAVVALGSAAPAFAADAPKLHALLVCDTTDENLRKAAGKDRDHMRGILKDNIPDKQLAITVIEGAGAKIRPAAVLDYYKALHVGPNDALLFYYTGHGSIRQGGVGDAAYTFELQSDGHPGKAPLARSDVRKAMEAKNPRLIVILSDCCSNRLDLPAPRQVGTFAVALPGPVTATSPLMQSLFFDTTGTVSITAATKDVAVCDAEIGGYFTYSLFNTVGKTSGKPLNWTEFYDKLKMATPDTHKWAIKKGNADAPDPGHKLQTPEALSLGHPKKVGGDAEPAADAGKLYAVVSLTNSSDKAVRVQLKWPAMEKWATIELKPGQKQHATQVVANTDAYSLQLKLNGQERSLKSKVIKSVAKPVYADGVEYDLGKMD